MQARQLLNFQFHLLLKFHLHYMQRILTDLRAVKAEPVAAYPHLPTVFNCWLTELKSLLMTDVHAHRDSYSFL